MLSNYSLQLSRIFLYLLSFILLWVLLDTQLKSNNLALKTHDTHPRKCIKLLLVHLLQLSARKVWFSSPLAIEGQRVACLAWHSLKLWKDCTEPHGWQRFLEWGKFWASRLFQLRKLVHFSQYRFLFYTLHCPFWTALSCPWTCGYLLLSEWVFTHLLCIYVGE